MRIIITSIILSLTISLFPQNSDLNYREINKDLNYKLNIIDSIEYQKVTPTKQEKRLNSLSEQEFIEKYPHLFIKNGNCYDFKAIKNEPIIVCGFDSTKNLKERTNYEFKGQYCDFALIFISGYESRGFISVDLKNGTSFYTMGVPKTIDCETSISHSNYYMEEEIAIINLNTKNSLVLGIEDWTTDETKQIDNEYFIKLKKYSNLKLIYKYIKIKIIGYNTG